MRSRYTAYAKNNEAYLCSTWHASTRPAEVSLKKSQPDKWLGLKIVRAELGILPATTGIVEFIARYKVKGRAARVHEISNFIHEDGQWFYVDGQVSE